MPSPHAPAQHITFQVHDTAGQAYDVVLTVHEATATGTILLTAQPSQKRQEHSLTQMQKHRDGTTVTCKVGVATATLSIHDSTPTPTLHLVASVFFPVLDVTYTLHPSEQQRLVAWVKTLQLTTQT